MLAIAQRSIMVPLQGIATLLIAARGGRGAGDPAPGHAPVGPIRPALQS